MYVYRHDREWIFFCRCRIAPRSLWGLTFWTQTHLRFCLWFPQDVPSRCWSRSYPCSRPSKCQFTYVLLRPNTSSCPRLLARLLRLSWKRGKNKRDILALWLTWCSRSERTAEGPVRVRSTSSSSSMKIFNEYRSLTPVGELNPYWRSSMNVEV